MNGYAREYLIGRAEAAAQNAGMMLKTLPEFAEKSIKLSYLYLLAANGKYGDAWTFLEKESEDLYNTFNSALKQAQIIAQNSEY